MLTQSSGRKGETGNGFLLWLPSATWHSLALGIVVAVLVSGLSVGVSALVGGGALWVSATLALGVAGAVVLIGALQSQVFLPGQVAKPSLRMASREGLLAIPIAVLPGCSVVFYSVGTGWWGAVCLVAAGVWAVIWCVAAPLGLARDISAGALVLVAGVVVVRRPVAPLGALVGCVTVGVFIAVYQPTLVGFVPLVVAALATGAAWSSAPAAGVNMPCLRPAPRTFLGRRIQTP